MRRRTPRRRAAHAARKTDRRGKRPVRDYGGPCAKPANATLPPDAERQDSRRAAQPKFLRGHLSKKAKSQKAWLLPTPLASGHSRTCGEFPPAPPLGLLCILKAKHGGLFPGQRPFAPVAADLHWQFSFSWHVWSLA